MNWLKKAICTVIQSKLVIVDFSKFSALTLDREISLENSLVHNITAIDYNSMFQGHSITYAVSKPDIRY